MSVFEKAAGPLAFSDLLARAQKLVPGLGQATLYRHLKTLLGEQRVRPVAAAEGETRYESAGRRHHHHFHCRVCDQMLDIEGCPMPKAQELAVPPGFRVEAHEVTLFGVCGECV